MVGAALCLAAAAVSATAPADPGAGFTVKVVALVEAGPASWPAVPADARIEPDAVPARRREFLKSAPGIPVKAPAVARALAAALAPLPRDARRSVAKVLDALADWTGRELAEVPGPVGAPAGWRDAAAVLADRRGNAFENVRALVALCRAAGIPARPSFNGVPMVVVYATPREGPGAWSVWDPLHPSGSFRALPVLWLPLRAAEILPVAVKPAAGCRVVLECRRVADAAAARAVFASTRATGAFPAEAAAPLAAGTPRWWEVWTIGAAFDVPPPAGTTLRVPLPYVKELGYGTRDHGVWTSDPARPGAATPPLAETDQDLGGLVMTLAVRL